MVNIHRPPGSKNAPETLPIHLIKHVNVVKISHHQTIGGFEYPAQGDVLERGRERIGLPTFPADGFIENIHSFALVQPTNGTRIGQCSGSQSDRSLLHNSTDRDLRVLTATPSHG